MLKFLADLGFGAGVLIFVIAACVIVGGLAYLAASIHPFLLPILLFFLFAWAIGQSINSQKE